MLADLGLLLRALVEQRLYRQYRHRGGGVTLSTRAAIRSLTCPFAAQLPCESADGRGRGKGANGFASSYAASRCWLPAPTVADRRTGRFKVASAPFPSPRGSVPRPAADRRFGLCQPPDPARREPKMTASAPAVNAVTLVGNLTADPVLRTIDEHRKVCEMRLAVNDQQGPAAAVHRRRHLRQPRRGVREVPRKGPGDRRHRPTDLPRMGRR